MTFSEKLTILRKRRGLSQEQLAEVLDVSRQSVSKWEAQQAFPETAKIIMIANIFNVSIDTLLKDDLSIEFDDAVSIVSDSTNEDVTEETAVPQHTEVKATTPQQTYTVPTTTPTQKKPRRVLKGISIFCLFGVALLLLMSFVADSTMFIGALVYGILGILFLMLSKTPKGSIYLLGKEKGIKQSMFILICIFLLFASVIVFSATQCQHEYILSVTKAATCTEDGTETYTCTLCEHEKSETLKATGHSMQNGKCSVCGYSEAKPESSTTAKADTTPKENTKTTLNDIEKWYTSQIPAVSGLLIDYASSINGVSHVNVNSSRFRFGEDSGWYDCHYTFAFTCKINGSTYNGEARAFLEYQGTEVTWFHFEIFDNSSFQSLVEHYDDSYDQILEDYYKELEAKYN